MSPAIPRGASGPKDQPNFRTDAPLTGLEVWLNGTHAELDAALTVLATAGRTLWRSERRRLHGHGDADRHTVNLRLSLIPATNTARPARTGRAGQGGELIDLKAARHHRESA